MWARFIQYVPCGAVFFTLACAPSARSTVPSASERGSNLPGADGENETALRSGVGSDGGGSDSRHPLLDGRESAPDAALPRLNYKHLGMHIGGESNSPDAKRPWFTDIERSEDSILTCYRFVDAPEQGGSYGVDLYVGREGGAPEVRGSRQKLGGEGFDRCMREAFEKVDFHRPERPTVFSYSIFFELED